MICLEQTTGTIIAVRTWASSRPSAEWGVCLTVEEVAARPERCIDHLRNGLVALKRPVIPIPTFELHLGRLASEEVHCH